MHRATLAIALACATATPAAAQTPLSLADALRRADSGAFANRIATDEARAQRGDGTQALRGILPTLRLEAGYARTTDPIGVFGVNLRQRVITQQDFDPARLNHPAATPNHAGAVILEQPLLNVDAWLGRSAAARASDARALSATWTELQTRVEVVRGYYGAVLTGERVATLEAALEAARGHVGQAESLVEQGMVTRSDALLAQVRAGEVETQLIEARGDAALAKRQLAVLLGDPADTVFTLPAQLPSVEHVATLDAVGEDAIATGASPDSRADVQAAAAGHAATRMDARRARASWLPRLNGVARYDWNSASAPFRGAENWSVGVVASWTPLAGGSQLGMVRAAAAREDAALARVEAARAQAALDIAAQDNAWAVVRERMRIAAAAVEHSVEAHRIVARKYEGGLATVVELLGASAAETEARLRLSVARYDAIGRAAMRLLARGLDPALLGTWAMELR